MRSARMSRSDHIVSIILFGSLFAYFLYGAMSGDLYLPGKRGPGVHLRALGAWMVTGAPVLLYIGIMIRGDTFMFASEKMQNFMEILFLCGGVALIMAGPRFG